MEDIVFKRPELEDKEIISTYFAKAPSRSCERTFANVYLWSRHYHVKYAIVENALVFMDDEFELAYAYPAGEPAAVKNALDRLMEYSREKGNPFKLYNVTEENFAQLEEFYPGRFTVEYDRDEADYVYERDRKSVV